jgi:hypothetical protein
VPNELLLAAPRAIRLAPYEELPLQADQVRAQAIVSGISHGTEGVLGAAEEGWALTAVALRRALPS